MAEDLLSKWLNPHFLRTLLLDPDKNKSTCIQIARFVAAYYLDYLLFVPADEGLLPSLYLWGGYKKEDLKPTDTILDRTKVCSLLPAEYSPALPALLMVKCDSLIEAISYVDHFDDRRTSLILRLLADSMHDKDLTIDFIKTMIVECLPLQIAESMKFPNSSLKFAENFTESILQLDVAMQEDLLIFMEHHLISSAEFIFSELPWESEKELPNPILEDPCEIVDSEETQAFKEIYGYVQILMQSFTRSNRMVDQLNFVVRLVSKDSNIPKDISANYTLQRVFLLMLRITYRQLFSDALRNKDENLGKIAERYKLLLKDEEEGEHILLKEWFESADKEEMERAQNFIDDIQGKIVQTSNLPPLSPHSRELWLRRIVLNSTTNHRDIRQERTMDWFRSVCHPKHRVCDVVMSQMLFINSQWTSPGFTFIQPGCLALRLSIHPHDLCLGTTTTTVNFSASARDILYSPTEELGKIQEEPKDKLFTPRNSPNSPDLISKYAEKHKEMTKSMAQTARYFTPFEEQLRVFSRQQDELQRELNRENEFLKRAGHYHHPDPLEDVGVLKGAVKEGTEAPSRQQIDEALAKQMDLMNKRIDEVVKELAEKSKSMYIREEDEESEISEIPLHYDSAPIQQGAPVIEKLDFGMLSSRTPVPVGDSSFKGSARFEHLEESGMKTPTISNDSQHLSTAKSFSNPLFPERNPRIPIEWMKLLPLEGGSARFADNYLSYNKAENLTPRQEDFHRYLGRQIVSERGIGTQTSQRNSSRSGETQTKYGIDSNVANVTTKVMNVKSMKKMSNGNMSDVVNRIQKY